MRVAFLILIFIMASGLLFAVEWMNPSELKPGMKGYGLTVFQGWKPERFEVEIIDVMKNTSPGGDMILARLKGGILEKSGVIAGMSGSPVYIDDKLIGAVAYSWAFSKEPICGITPIARMVKEKRNLLDYNRAVTTSDDRLKAIRTPILVSGFVGEAREWVRDLFENKNAEGQFLLTGGSLEESPGEQTADPSDSLKAGDAIAINLVDGDFKVQGIGTVTYVSNQDVFIFGHPMELSGTTLLPISKSYIYTVIPSSQISFKIGASSLPIGSVLYDGQSGVYCELNHDSAMVPVDLKLVNGSAAYEYHFRVTDNKNYFPNLSTGAISSALINHSGYFDDKKIRMGFKLYLKYQGKDVLIQNEFLYALNPAYFSIYAMLGDISIYLSIFYNNLFGDVQVKKMEVAINIEKGLSYYTLDSFSVDKSVYYPGETIQGKAVLKEYKGGYETREILIKIPDDASPGPYTVLTGSEMTFYSELSKLFPKYFAMNNMDDLVRIANFKQDATLLTAGLITAKPGVQVRDRKLEKFPDNYQSLFNRTADKVNAVVIPDILRSDLPLPNVLFGSYKVNISIMNKTYQTLE